MTLLASGNVTRGISGQDFLTGYGIIGVAALLGILVARWRLAAGAAGAGAASGGSDQLGARPHDVAYLNGGSELAVLSALSSMRVAGTVVGEGRGRVRAGARPAPDADELERAIHLATVVPIARRELVRNRIVGTALENARQRLVDAGLLLNAAQRHRIRRLGLWMVAVGVLGLVRLQAGAANGAPVGYLVLELFAVGVAAAVLLCWAPQRSRRGTAELSRLRKQHNEIAPGMRPDWTVYGPAVAGLGVGIFGARALWASDPAFAAEVQAQRTAAAMGGSGYHGGGYYGGGGCGGTGSSGGGGGCGGGGCGGGCGGGG